MATRPSARALVQNLLVTRPYSITKTGRAEYERLHEDVLPFLGALARSLEGIFQELYD